VVELCKIAALGLLVGLVCSEWLEPLDAAIAGAAVFYLLLVRIGRPPPGLG
jgi:hypothetical protein